MAKDNVYSVLQKPVAKHGRNQFNLNNQHVYSMKAGQIVPIKCTHYMPNDYLKMKAKDFSITFPMNSAPFLRARKEFSFYSVYYSAVWSLFNQYMAGRQDPKSSAFGINPILQEPRIKLLNLYAGVLNQFGAYLFMEHVIPTYCKYFAPSGLRDAYTEETLISTYRQDFLNRVYTRCFDYRASFSLGDSSYPVEFYFTTSPFFWSSFNATPWEVREQSDVLNATVYQDVVGHFRVYNQLRKLDMLGYGNYYLKFRQEEDSLRNLISHIEQGDSVDWSTFLSISSDIFVQLAFNLVSSFATWDNQYRVQDIEESDVQSFKMVNLYPICAYNSIFYHFFRNSYYDNNYLSHNYSLDFVSASSGGSRYNEVSLNDFSSRFLDIEYHQWKKDLFTSVLPDEQFGAVSSLQLSNVLGNLNFTPEASLSSSSVERFSPSSAPSNPSISAVKYTSTSNSLYSGSWSSSVSPSFDVIALKRAEMLQEYRQTLMRAGNKTSDIFRALYGGAPSSEHLDDIIPRFLETFGEDLVVDPVVSTADTGQPVNGSLGDIAARGKTSGESNSFKFDAGENFGCIICLAYVVPSAMYNSYMLDKHLLELSPEQHFIPNFENLGLEDIYTDELNMLIPANDVASLGKQARYYHKKTDVDKVHGAFCAAPFYSGTTFNPDTFNRLVDDKMLFGEFNHWISARTDMQTRSITLLRDFYINPSVLDNVFVRPAGADQADDQFLCTTLLEVDATKAISKTGFVNFV